MKHIALFVIGHSPALVTETLAASTSNPPHSIKICTTMSGAKILRKRFFNDGGWAQFQITYPCYQQTHFDADCITSPQDLDDIRNTQDNQIMSQAILEMVQDAVQHSAMVSASIAGGRKTMGYLLGLAMSMFGRTQDRLTHVLVPPTWEQDPNFLFPHPADAHKITLVDIPFIRLSKHLKPAIAKANIEAIVASAQTAMDASLMEPLTLHIRSQSISYLGKNITLPDREFALYQFFAEQKAKHCQHKNKPSCEACSDCFLSYNDIDRKKDDLLLIRSQFGGVNSGHYVRFEKAWAGKHAAANNIHEPLRRLVEYIEDVFAADPRAECLMIKNIGKKGDARYGISADKTQLSIERE